MATFKDREQKVLSFMEKVREDMVVKEEDETFRNSTDYKLKTLANCENDAREICLDKIFAQIYKDAVPLSDDYKNACPEDLDGAFKAFMATRCPKGLEFYVKEGLRKNSPFAKRVLEAVDNLVSDTMKDKALNIEDINTDDLVFNSNDDTQKKLDIIGQELGVPEISDAVKNNVRATAMSEITRAKERKEALKNIEAELANDINMNTSEAVQTALELRDINTKKDYTPTLFEGVLINKLNKLTAMNEAGQLPDTYLYGALTEYGKSDIATESGEPIYATVEDLAFVEAVKEYTGLSMLKALKFENFTKQSVADLAQEYAEARF